MKGLIGLVALIALTAGCQTVKTPRQAVEQSAANPAAMSFPEVSEFVPSGHPVGSCVTESEMEADQAIRLHAEMMVTGLTCHAHYREPTLFSRYQRFTVDHAERIRESQQTMGDFLGRYGSGASQRLFDAYQTQLANDEARLMSEVTAPTYCQLRRNMFYAAAGFDGAELEAYVARLVERYRDRYRVCG